jgi:DNA-binding transcriptional LysR family regulator
MEPTSRVSHSGSFTIAANQLGLSRALGSRPVSELETRLGVRLLNRSTRSLNLTEQSRAYLEFCEQAFGQIESRDRPIVRTRAKPVGTLELVAPHPFGTLHLADAIVVFAKLHSRRDLILDDVSFLLSAVLISHCAPPRLRMRRSWSARSRSLIGSFAQRPTILRALDVWGAGGARRP